MGDDIWSGGFFGTNSTGNIYQLNTLTTMDLVIILFVILA